MKEEELRNLVDTTTKTRLKVEDLVEKSQKGEDVSEEREELVSLLEKLEELSGELKESCDCFKTRDGEKIDL